MPLLGGKSNDIISENIRTLRNEGKSEAQAAAIAYSKAGRTKKKLKAVSKKVAKSTPDNKLHIAKKY